MFVAKPFVEDGSHSHFGFSVVKMYPNGAQTHVHVNIWIETSPTTSEVSPPFIHMLDMF